VFLSIHYLSDYTQKFDVLMKTQSVCKPEHTYHAYLLKIWMETDPGLSGNHLWHFSLEDVHAGTRRAFRDLDSLIVYLHDLTNPHPNAASQE
jgi:hypothetical protein